MPAQALAQFDRSSRGAFSLLWRYATAVVLAAACVPSPVTEIPDVVPVPGLPAITRGVPWELDVRFHVDLWLHGFGMLQQDTAGVPYFRHGYSQQIRELQRSANIETLLEANREQLQARLIANPALVNAQFVTLYFPTWTDLRSAADLLLQAEGDPQRGTTQPVQRTIALMATYFPSAADRDWLRLFTLALEDERRRFYEQYWTQQQADRSPVMAALDSLWHREVRPRLQRFLNNSRQMDGRFIPSLALNGEGRTLPSGERGNIIVTSYPDRPTDAVEAIYVLAHETVGTVTAQVIDDQTSAAQKRQGLDAAYQGPALVIGGLLLLERTAPELADGYARYYLRAAGRQPGAQPRAALLAAFRLPQEISEAIGRQFDTILGGI